MAFLNYISTLVISALNLVLGLKGKCLVLHSQADLQVLRLFLHQLRPVGCRYELKKLGGRGDGSYFVPDVLEGLTACFSPGVASNSSFELDLAERGIKCYMCDHTVSAPPVKHKKFEFSKLKLTSYNSEHSITLETWINSCAENEGDLILQMDIEGSEYEVLQECSLDILKKFRIMVIEFHQLDVLFSKIGFGLLSCLFDKLSSTHSIVQLSPNNCNPNSFFKKISIPPTLEVTFLRNDFAKAGAGEIITQTAENEKNVHFLPRTRLSKDLL